MKAACKIVSFRSVVYLNQCDFLAHGGAKIVLNLMTEEEGPYHEIIDTAVFKTVC